MSIQCLNVRLHLNNPLLTTLQLFILLGSVCLSDAIRCYVCGPLDQGFNQTCENFMLNISRYEQQCPNKFFGCSTHMEGVDSRRECERMRMNDCKKANNIEYCYCSSNLCNGVTPQLQIQQQQPDTDDEDILGDAGSGDGTNNDLSGEKNKNDINVIIQNVGGNSIETIETKKTNGVDSYTTPSIVIILLSVSVLFFN